MKKLVLQFILGFIAVVTYSQPCLPDGIMFTNQAQIDSFPAKYPYCDAIGGNVSIHGSDITELNELSNLTSIGGYLVIFNNNSLTSLSGLENLTFIGGSLVLNGNNSLTGITDLENVTSLGGYLTIHDNNSLTSLSGLDNISAGTISDIYIYNNQLLATCEAQTICDYLSAPNGNIEIHDNAMGCNSQEEVEEACGITSILEPYINDDIKFYPNPFTTSTTIEYTLKIPQLVTITFYDSFGRVVDNIIHHQQQGLQKIVWTPEGLNEGVYYFRVETGGQVVTGKVVYMIK